MDDYISRKAAIDAVMGEPSDSHYPTWYADIIRNLPSAEPEPSDVARAIATIIENEKDMRVIAQPVRKGKWLKAYGDHEAFGIRPFYRYCSECNEATVFPYNFCPNCGASMSEGEGDG